MNIITLLKMKFKNADFVTTLIAITLFLLAGLQSVSAQCPTPPGDPSVYGNGSWIGYVYSGLDANNPPQNTFTTTVYRGYLTQPEQFDQDLVNAAPTATTICGTYADSFSMRFRMKKTFPAGYYTFTIGGDDGERLSFNGGASWAMQDWNYHSYQTSTQTFFLSGEYFLVLENYDQGGQSHLSFSYTYCSNYSTAPTAITGTTSICNGSSTTLTATGGTSVTGSTYQWGTGNTIGNNIIAGTGASITVSPTANTTYWVRRIDATGCGTSTTGITQLITVTTPATAPTTITGTTTICIGTTTTLTATGGTGATYEWGTGTVGTNIISGQNTNTLTVTPTATTTYWVRRTNLAPCAATAGVSAMVTVNTIDGDQTSYGTNSWIGYVYATIGTANPPADTFSVPYRGYITEPEIFDQNWGNAPLSGPNVCGTYPTRFAVRFKMTKNFTPGYYTFTVGGDDGYRLSIDGGVTFPVSNWVEHGYANSTSTTYFLSGTTNLVLEFFEQGGDARVTFNYVACTDISTAPTFITGTTTVCNNTPTTLTATGGYASANATYQWGTGTTVGNNVIGGNTASITVNPGTNSTTYWVRRLDPAPCNLTTTGVTQLVTVVAPSTNPTSITGTNSICVGGSTTLTANGGTTSANGNFQWGTGIVGNNIIAGATTNTIVVSPIANTTYWVRRIDTSPCNTQTAAQTYNVTVAQISTAPTSINNSPTVCSPNGGVTLTAIGGTSASGATFQWGTGSVIGTNPIGGQTNSSYYVNPTAVTTYWVRRFDPNPCGTYTTGVTVTVYPASTAPTTITGTNLICAGSNTILTASGGTSGSGSTYQWGTGATGSNIITGETNATITVSPASTVTYWARRLDNSPCTTVTAQANFTVTVNKKSVAPTSITGPSTLCYTAGGGTLTAVGGTPGTNATYQWGFGAIGSNIQGSTINTMYINPSVTTTYWVRLIDPAPCSATSAAATFTVTVTTTSTSPASIAGTTTICSGGSTTLTANGGTAGIGSSYQWGTGTIGNNIITGQTGASIIVSPSATTTYWVRRIDGSPCTTAPTYGPNVTVTVNNLSTAPTTISGAGTNCPGISNTLTASGGTSASGSVYQWGTGSIGSNIIGGQTGATVIVAPTATTTYWVRRYDAGCNAYTAAATATVTVSVPGNPNTFGASQWNVYGYNGADITLATPVYSGYYTQATVGFDSTTSWNVLASPSSASTWQGCTLPVDNFTFVAKRRNFACGTYTLTMQNWDDAAEVYVNGTLVWSCGSYSGGGACPGAVGTFNLGSTSTMEIRIRENGGNASAILALTNISASSSAPTSLTGANSICIGSSTTLTASGGTAGTNAEFQWGTGTIGSNIIADETTATLTVNPTVTTTYWVRRINSFCGQTTPSLTKMVTVNPATVPGTLETTVTTICSGTTPNAITITGYTGNVIKWQSASNAAFTVGVTDIASTAATLTAAEMGTITATRYFRAAVESCDLKYTAPVQITVPTAVTYANGAWSATPTATTPVIIESNLTLSSDLHVCSCQVKNGVTLTVNPHANLIVETTLAVEPTANLVIEDKGSLVQVNDDATDTGAIKVKRNTTRMKLYDYCYWSSPVLNNTLFQLSPNTLSDKYYRFDPAINNWVSIAGGAQAMVPGKGYIVRAPQGWSATNATNGVYNAEFNGVPNNGIIPTTIQKALGTTNLIGNPYPSAIDIDLFLTDPANRNVISGTIYLWTHNTAISSTIPGNAVYNYTADDYAKYNLTGGVQSAASAITGTLPPDGKVASGQGFFIEANPALAIGTYTANFKNSMRVAGHNNGFYRNSNVTQTENPVEKNRLWLNMSNTAGAYNQILVGYVTGATNGFDNLYDGKIFPAGNALTMYTVSGTDNYAIQGKALPFENTDVIPVGYKTTIAGDFTMALENFDGLFENQDVYVIDHLTGTTQNLKTASYNFTSAIGTFNTRFEVVFQPSATLGTEHMAFDENSVSMYSKDQKVGINASTTIEKVEIYDLLGRIIYTADKVNANTFRTPELLSAQQVLIVKVTLEGNYIVSKKVVLD